MRTVAAEKALSALKGALRNGGRAVGPRRAEVAYHGDCEKPIELAVHGIRYRRHEVPYPDQPEEPIVPWTTMTVRCRKCEPCLKAHGAKWARRAKREIDRSSRTWLVTLTLSPGEHYRALCESGGRDTFEARHRAISRWLTLYIKRVREASRGPRRKGMKRQPPIPFRYVLVCEAHVSGLPHYHMLIHERVLGKQLPKRLIQAAWPHGFSNCKLVDIEQGWKAAWYAAKYLGKDTRARVRASVSYGALGGSPAPLCPGGVRGAERAEEKRQPEQSREHPLTLLPSQGEQPPVGTDPQYEDLGLCLPCPYDGETDFRVKRVVRETREGFERMRTDEQLPD